MEKAWFRSRSREDLTTSSALLTVAKEKPLRAEQRINKLDLHVPSSKELNKGNM